MISDAMSSIQNILKKKLLIATWKKSKLCKAMAKKLDVKIY